MLNKYNDKLKMISMTYSLSELIVLSTNMIDAKITETKPGVYTLYVSGGLLKIQYVGRSDDDVNTRLKKHVGGKYSYFKYQYATSPKDAFEKECEIYHDHSPPDNKSHPDRPNGANWQCPRCDHFK